MKKEFIVTVKMLDNNGIDCFIFQADDMAECKRYVRKFIPLKQIVDIQPRKA